MQMRKILVATYFSMLLLSIRSIMIIWNKDCNDMVHFNFFSNKTILFNYELIRKLPDIY